MYLDCKNYQANYDYEAMYVLGLQELCGCEPRLRKFWSDERKVLKLLSHAPGLQSLGGDKPGLRELYSDKPRILKL